MKNADVDYWCVRGGEGHAQAVRQEPTERSGILPFEINHYFSEDKRYVRAWMSR